MKDEFNIPKVALGEVCDFVRGVVFDGDETIDVSKEGYVPILRAGNIGDELYIRDDLVWVPEKRISKNQYFQIDDIAICMASGSPKVLGKTAQLKESFIGSVGAFCGIIRPTKADPNYIAYYLKSSEFMAWRDSQANGVNIQNLRPTEIQEIEIPLPPLTEQKRIASLLARADRLRQLRRTAHDLSASVLQSVFFEMFEKYLKPNSPTTPMEKLVTITGGGTPSRDVPEYFQGDIPWLTSKDMHGEYIYDTQEHVTEKAIRESAAKLVPVGSILLVVKSKILMHRLPIAITKVPLCHGQDIKSIQCSNKVNPHFLVAVLKYNEANILFQARGANTEGLTLPMLHEIKVPNVPLSLQEEFAGVVARVESLRGRMGESTRQVEELFESLLAESFGAQLISSFD